MTAPVPETLAKEINDGINALILASDEFRDRADAEVVSLFDAAEKLQKVDARASFSLRGSLSAVCGDVDGVREYFRKALYQPNTESTRLEYWIALTNVGLYSEAAKEVAWLLNPRLHMFPTIWERAASSGLVLAVADLLPKARQTFPELAKADTAAIERIAQFMTERSLADAQVTELLDLMGEIQRSNRIMFAGQLISYAKVMSPPDDPPYLYVTMRVQVNHDQLHQMNRDLVRQVVQRLPGGSFPAGLVAAFQKAPAAQLRAAA